MSSSTPLADFRERLIAFATGQKRGIRNPFVMVPVDPPAEQTTASRLQAWADDETPVPVQPVYLDRVMPQTDVFQTVLGLPSTFYQNGNGDDQTDLEEDTLRDNLAAEMVDEIISAHEDACERTEQVLLLLHLGALYPFARSSELLDEMDRRRVRATVGIPFPGEIIGGKLSFFGERAQHYYPAHRIDDRITMDHLQ
ncbi:hypothetical protein GGQ19_002582 [Salinibacter ruber]|uniref:DUF1788 domain-containing protein n=1 Tax=Salinibacter ruber TaxID=146919 RepID=UPI002169076A|nr:DUF1788 domain-containing protein [Salinibacter ruber]MCS3751387.1 hypothetical protein [Salinibacter ruber]